VLEGRFQFRPSAHNHAGRAAMLWALELATGYPVAPSTQRAVADVAPPATKSPGAPAAAGSSRNSDSTRPRIKSHLVILMNLGNKSLCRSEGTLNTRCGIPVLLD